MRGSTTSGTFSSQTKTRSSVVCDTARFTRYRTRASNKEEEEEEVVTLLNHCNSSSDVHSVQSLGTID